VNPSCFLPLNIRIVLDIDCFTNIILEMDVRNSAQYGLVEDSPGNEDGEMIQFYGSSLLSPVVSLAGYYLLYDRKTSQWRNKCIFNR
jgi:hypothetical protein